MKPLMRHKRRLIRYRRRGLMVVRTFPFPGNRHYGYQIDAPRPKFDWEGLRAAIPRQVDWVCPYKYDPHSPACQGYHREGCDHSCDRIRQMQLRREGKI